MKAINITTIIALSLASVLCLAGCMNTVATGEVTANATLHFTSPVPVVLAHIPCGESFPVLSTTAQNSFDVSDVFSSLQKQGSLQVLFEENSLLAIEGSMSSFKYAELYVNNNGDVPELLAKTDFNTSPSGKVEVPIVMDTGRLFQILSQGKVIVTTTLETCIPSTDSIVVDYTLRSDLKFNTNKSL